MQEGQDRTAQLEREKRLGRPAAYAAFAAALLMAAGLFVGQSTFRGLPADNNPAQLRFLADHVSGVVLSGVLGALGFLLLSVVAYYLYMATSARKPELFRLVLVIGVMGPLLYGVASIARAVILTAQAGDYADRATQTIKAAQEIAQGTGSTGSVVIVAVLQAGQLALGFWLVMGSLYAMRVGLLTRPIGILGIILAVATIFQAPFAPVLMVFWLLALALLFLGHWPGGRPKAWETGTAVPWPSAKQRSEALAKEREQREKVETAES